MFKNKLARNGVTLYSLTVSVEFHSVSSSFEPPCLIGNTRSHHGNCRSNWNVDFVITLFCVLCCVEFSRNSDKCDKEKLKEEFLFLLQFVNSLFSLCVGRVIKF